MSTENLNRKDKIELLNAIRTGKKSLSDLVIPNHPEIWEDEPGRPGFYREIVTNRVCGQSELKAYFSSGKKKGIAIMWCDADFLND